MKKFLVANLGPKSRKSWRLIESEVVNKLPPEIMMKAEFVAELTSGSILKNRHGKITPAEPDPRFNVFNVLRSKQHSGQGKDLVVMEVDFIHRPHRKKILVYTSAILNQLPLVRIPQFETDGSLIAQFAPTEEGWKTANQFAAFFVKANMNVAGGKSLEYKPTTQILVKKSTYNLDDLLSWLSANGYGEAYSYLSYLTRNDKQNIHMNESVTSTKLSGVLSGGFEWDNTPYGYNYWNNLADAIRRFESTGERLLFVRDFTFRDLLGWLLIKGHTKAHYYLNNLTKYQKARIQFNEDLEDSSLLKIIDGSFTWSLTPQGEKYWATIRDEILKDESGCVPKRENIYPDNMKMLCMWLDHHGHSNASFYLTNLSEREKKAIGFKPDSQGLSVKNKLWNIFQWSKTPQGVEYWKKIYNQMP